MRYLRVIYYNRFVLLLAATCVVCLTACRSSPTRQASTIGDYADFVASREDLGDIPWHSEIPFSLEFENRSNQPVTVAAIQTSCVCTEVNSDTITNEIILPGSSVPIEGILRAGRRIGPHKADVDLMLTSGLVRTARLEYNVLATYKVSPLEIPFNPVSLPASKPEDDFRTILFTSTDVNITNVSTSVPWVQFGRHRLNERETEITIALRPRFLSAGLNDGLVFVETDDPYRPVQQVSVRVEAKAALRAVPNNLFLREGDERIIYLVNDKGDRVPITEEPHPT